MSNKDTVATNHVGVALGDGSEQVNNTGEIDSNNDIKKHVSSLNLEPNPFEQSFASTKKSLSSNSVTGSPSSLLNVVTQEASQSQTLFKGTNYSTGANNVDSNSGRLVQRNGSASHLFSDQRPLIQSPPMLTPGGSKRLPPLISPNFGHQQSLDTTNRGFASALMSNTNTNTNSMKNNTATTPGFMSYLPRTGLTPNESSIRSGLTPGALNASFSYPLLPSLSNSITSNNINNDKRNQLNQPNQPLTSGISEILGNPKYNTPITNNNNLSMSPQPLFKPVPPMTTSLRDIQEIKGNGTEHLESDKTSITSKEKKTGTKRKKSISRTPKGTKRNKNMEIGDVKFSNDALLLDEISDDSQLSPEDQERKRKEFLERNRVAASKFRKRKKEYIKRIEDDISFYENEYNEMSGVLFKFLPVNSPNGAQDEKKSMHALIPLLESAITKNDDNAALTILNHMKQLIVNTKIYQRNGINPIDDHDDLKQTRKGSVDK